MNGEKKEHKEVPKDTRKVFAVRLDEAQDAKLVKYASEHGKSKTAVILELIGQLE